MRPIRASYESRCGICDQPILEGDEIVKADGEWVHADCAEEDGYEVER